MFRLKCILALVSVKVITQLQVLPKDVVDYPKFYCFKLSLQGLWKEKLQFSHKMLVLMQQLLGENLYFVSHRKQGRIMMTVAFERQNL